MQIKTPIKAGRIALNPNKALVRIFIRKICPHLYPEDHISMSKCNQTWFSTAKR